MYLLATRWTNRDGSAADYLQLAHNGWHPVTSSAFAATSD